MRFPKDVSLVIEEATPQRVAALGLHTQSKKLTLVRVKMTQSADIVGFGMPYANAIDEEPESWLNKNAPFAGKYTLRQVLLQKDFTIVMEEDAVDMRKHYNPEKLLPPFQYPYPRVESEYIEEFKGQDLMNRGGAFPPKYRCVNTSFLSCLVNKL